jgi:hypothetical protein
MSDIPEDAVPVPADMSDEQANYMSWPCRTWAQANPNTGAQSMVASLNGPTRRVT